VGLLGLGLPGADLGVWADFGFYFGIFWEWIGVDDSMTPGVVLFQFKCWVIVFVSGGWVFGSAGEAFKNFFFFFLFIFVLRGYNYRM